MMNPNQNDKMHPEDVRNLIIFAICSIAIWFMYDTFILAPQTKAMKEARMAQEQLALTMPTQAASEGTLAPIELD